MAINDLHIIMVIDESGSMDSVKGDIVGSINKFIREQQELEVDQSTFSLVKFSTKVTWKYEKKLLSDAKEIMNGDYTPDGMTALYDAIGQSIKKYDNDKSVCMVIVTDGQENSSKDYSHAHVKDLISQKEKLGWKFIYLSADLNTAKQGEGIGLASCDQSVDCTGTNNVCVGYQSLGNGLAGACNTAVGQIRRLGKMSGMSQN